MLAGRGRNQNFANLIGGFAEGAVVAQDDVVALAALHAFSQLLSAKCSLDYGLEDSQVDIPACEFATVGTNFQIFAALHTVCKSRTGARHILHSGLDCQSNAFNGRQVASGNLDPDRCAYAG